MRQEHRRQPIRLGVFGAHVGVRGEGDVLFWQQKNSGQILPNFTARAACRLPLSARMSSTTNDEELHQLARAAGVDASPELLDTLIDLVRIVSPQGVIIFLRAAKEARLRAALSSRSA